MLSRTLTGTALNIPVGKLVALPIAPVPADPDFGTLVAGAPIEIPITDGALSGSIIAPASYTFTFYHGPRALPSFTAFVPDDDSGPIAIEEIIRGNSVPVEVLPYVMREGDSVLNLKPGGGAATHVLGQNDAGSLAWREFGHSHPIAEVVGLQDTLDGKADDSDVAAVQANVDSHKAAPLLDHPDGSVTDEKVGMRSIDDADAPTGDSGLLTRLFNFLANRVRSITGETSWRASPAMSLKDAKIHADAASPHAGHLKKTPTTATENEVQASAPGFPIMRMKRHASSVDADHVVDLRSADGTSVLMAISANGNIGIGGGPDPTAPEYGLYLVNRELEMTAGYRIRERGYGAAISFSPNAGANIQIQAPLQVGAWNALPAGQLEVVTGDANRVSEYVRLAAAQTANAVEVRSSDGGTLYYALTPAGVILHSGIQSLGGNARGAGSTDLQCFRTNKVYVAEGASSAVLSGRDNRTTSGAYCGIVIGGENNEVRARWGLAAGRTSIAAHELALVYGDNITSRWPGSITWGPGRLVLGSNEISRSLIGFQVRTTDDTPTALAALFIAAKFTGAFRGQIIARRTGGGTDFAVFDVEAAATRDATGSATIIYSSVTPKVNAPGYTVDWTLDATGQYLKPIVTGALGHDIGWSGYLLEVDVQW
jgi:hypothetical protein